MNDHSGLRYLFDQSNTNVRKAIWLSTINEFDFEIRYINGKEKRVADSLRRRVKVNQFAVVIYYGIDLHKWILRTRQHDDMYQYLRNMLQQ